MMRYDFPTTEDYTKEDIRKVQDELLLMAKIACKVLENNNIPYMLAFGSLLGAVRHQGFIPWDDDFDLFIFDENYEMAMDLLERELPSHLIVHSIKNDSLYFKSWNSIVNINTAVIEEPLFNPDNQLLSYKCLSLDLYRLKKINKKSKRKYQLEEALDFFKRKKELGIIKEKLYLTEIKKINNEMMSLEKHDCENHLDSFFFIIGMKEAISIEDTLPLKRYKFSDDEFYGPNDADLYLKSMYGDYKTLPDLNDRRKHYKKVVFIKL